MSFRSISDAGMVFNGDAVEVLRDLPVNSIDLTIIDPPYESLEKYRSVGTTTRLKESKSSSNPWFRIFPDTRFPELFEQLYRNMKSGSHMYVFSNDESAYVIKPAVEAAGFKYWKQLIWVKVVNKLDDSDLPEEDIENGLRLGMGYHWRCTNERILFFEKGKRNLNNFNLPDTIFAARVNKGYPTEKPIKVVRRLLLNSSVEGETVLDCFAGSGVVGTVATECQRKFILIDVDITEIEKRGLCGDK